MAHQAPKFIVLVDMDGVLCDFETDFLKNFTRKHPNEPHIPLEERRGFYLNNQYESMKKGLGEAAMAIIETQGFFRNFKPIEGALQAVKEMSKMEGVSVFICTSPLTDFSVIEKFQWVEDHLGPSWTNKLVISKDKTLVVGDLLIDDKPRVKGEVSPHWKHILFTSCHNATLALSRSTAVERLHNWSDGRWKDMILEHQYKK